MSVIVNLFNNMKLVIGYIRIKKNVSTTIKYDLLKLYLLSNCLLHKQHLLQWSIHQYNSKIICYNDNKLDFADVRCPYNIIEFNYHIKFLAVAANFVV